MGDNKFMQFLRRLSVAIDRTRILMFVKLLMFFSLIYTAVAMYTVRNIYLANDIILMAAVVLILNRVDNRGGLW